MNTVRLMYKAGTTNDKTQRVIEVFKKIRYIHKVRLFVLWQLS